MTTSIMLRQALLYKDNPNAHKSVTAPIPLEGAGVFGTG